MPNSAQNFKLATAITVIVVIIILGIAVGVTMIISSHRATASTIDNTTLLPLSKPPHLIFLFYSMLNSLINTSK